MSDTSHFTAIRILFTLKCDFSVHLFGCLPIHTNFGTICPKFFEQSKPVISRPDIIFTQKTKLLVSMVRCQEYFQTLTLLVMEAYYGLVLKSKVLSLNGQTLEISSDLNPDSQAEIIPSYRDLAIRKSTFQPILILFSRCFNTKMKFQLFVFQYQQDFISSLTRLCISFTNR